MLLLIDNYDSFSYNLYQMCGTIQPDIHVVRNNAITLEEIRELERVDMIFYLLTNILDQSSEVLFAGKDAAETLANAFHCEVNPEKPLLLHGVVSRKKQFIPSMLGAMQNQ